MMLKYFWLVVFAAMTVGGILADSDVPPFHEGPNAERQNRMHEYAPNGPWGPGPM